MTKKLLSVWYAVGAFVAFVVQALGYSIWIQLAVFIVVVVITRLLAKPYVEILLGRKMKDEDDKK